MSVSRISFLLIFAILLSPLACTKQAREGREVRDEIGAAVRVPEKVDRVVSLAPSLTEMIFAVGGSDKLVGVTTYCNYPEAATKIEKIGDTQTPNIERIVALKPQVVFVSTASQLEAFTKTLDEQGIAVFAIHTTGLEDMLQDLKQLGDILGTQTAAQQEIDRLTARIKILEEKIELNNHWGHEIGIVTPRVFVQISNDPLFTIGRESFLTDLIKKAGGVSVTENVPTAYPKLSKEAAAALDPELILLSDSEDNREPSSAFQNSKAVKAGLVFRINADIISRPGPRLVDALEMIVEKVQRVRV
jgi:iron complex transport system substrate-binding protein